MTWTNDLPTEPGWYWIRYNSSCLSSEIQEVKIKRNGFEVGSPGHPFIESIGLLEKTDLCLEYSGPIEEPSPDLVGCFDRLLEKIDKLREEVVLIKDFYSEMEERHFES